MTSLERTFLWALRLGVVVFLVGAGVSAGVAVVRFPVAIFATLLYAACAVLYLRIADDVLDDPEPEGLT